MVLFTHQGGHQLWSYWGSSDNNHDVWDLEGRAVSTVQEGDNGQKQGDRLGSLPGISTTSGAQAVDWHWENADIGRHLSGWEDGMSPILGSEVAVTQPVVLPLCPQYQELQESAQLQGNSMKEVQVQISQLRQVIQKLQSQIGSLRKQVCCQSLLLLHVLSLHQLSAS